MFTPSQLHAAALAAWCGPALESCHISVAGQPGFFSYQVSYFLPGWSSATGAGFFSSCGHPCLDYAIAGALAEAAAAGVTLAAPAAPCPTCGEVADPFGECACSYVLVPSAYYFNE